MVFHCFLLRCFQLIHLSLEHFTAYSSLQRIAYLFILLHIISRSVFYLSITIFALVRPIISEVKTATFYLFEIFHTGFKDLDILLSIDIYSHTVATTFAVCHLTKDTSVRTGNTLDVHNKNRLHSILPLHSIHLPVSTYWVATCPFAGSVSEAIHHWQQNVPHRGKPDYSIHRQAVLSEAMETCC